MTVIGTQIMLSFVVFLATVGFFAALLVLSIVAIPLNLRLLGKVVLIIVPIAAVAFTVLTIVSIAGYDEPVGHPAVPPGTWAIFLFGLPAIVAASIASNKQNLIYRIDGHELEVYCGTRQCRLTIDGVVAAETVRTLRKKMILNGTVNEKRITVRVGNGMFRDRVHTFYDGTELAAAADTVVPRG
jgi:hypothetical protein